MTSNVEMFTGSKANQNAQKWLRQFEGAKLKHDSDAAFSTWMFAHHLEPGSRADKWYTTVLDDATRASYTLTVAAFNLKWPAIARTEPSTEDMQMRLDDHKLPAEMVGVRVETNDDEESEFSHILWVNELERLVQKLDDDKGLLIPGVRRGLPKAILRCLPGKLNTWTLFYAAIRDISIHALTLNAEDELVRDTTSTTLASLANVRISTPTPATYRAPAATPTPRPPNRVHWNSMPAAPAPAAAPTASIPLRTATAPPQTPQRPAATILTPAGVVPRLPWSARMTPSPRANPAPPTPQSKVRPSGAYEDLALQAVDNNVPRYTRDAQGFVEYDRDKRAWEIGNGGAGREVTWASKPIPLTPGSSPLGSSECYGCGIAGHRRDLCQETEHFIPKDEADWRARINGTLVAANRARRFASQALDSDTLPVFLINGEEVRIDPTVYDTSSMAFLDEEEEQGKE